MNVPYDSEFAAAVSACARKHAVPICGSGMHDGDLDHGTFVPLHFVNQLYGGYRLVRVGLSGLLGGRPPRRGARAWRRPRRDSGRTCVFLASGDLSHKLTGRGPLRLCGGRPRLRPRPGRRFWTRATWRGSSASTRRFSRGGGRMRAGLVPDHGRRSGGRAVHARAAKLRGPVRRGVRRGRLRGGGRGRRRRRGRGRRPRARTRDEAQDDLAAFEAGRTRSWRSPAPRWRGSCARDGPSSAPPDCRPSSSDARAGVFVSLHEGGELRGCIGTIEPGHRQRSPTRSSATAWRPPARTRASRRCAPDELDALSYSVDVLFPPEPVDSPAELDPARYGVIVTPRAAGAAFCCRTWRAWTRWPSRLPSPSARRASRPASDGVRLERFEVVRHDRGEAGRAVA